MKRAALAAVALLATAACSSPPSRERPPVEPTATRTPDLVEIAMLDSSIRLDVRYATANNFLGRPVYAEARAFLQRPAAEALVRVHRALAARGYGLVIFDGYRPWSVTKAFWDATPADKKQFVADPAQGSRHNRGCAVDLTLFELATGKAVSMPSEYDEMTERSHIQFAGGPEEPRARRTLLHDAMKAEGFSVYPPEWWHYDYRDFRSYPVLDVPFSKIGH